MASGPARVDSVDRLRGWIIALMALDHANAFWAGGPRVGEFWAVAFPEYDAWLPAVLRWLTHLCAPGFFVLMGASVALAAQAMRARGHDERAITRWFATRGAVLIVAQHLLVNPAWAIGSNGGGLTPGRGDAVFLYFGVLWSLGASMVTLAWLRRLPSWGLLGIAAAIVVASPSLVPDPGQGPSGFAWWTRLAAVPGQTGIVLVRYPWLPWLGLACAGIPLGRMLARSDQRTTTRRLVAIGIGLLAVFAAVRVHGGWGNTHVWDGRPLELLNVTKYPPSIAFVTLTVGINAVLLALFTWLRALDRVLVPLGRSALFVYVLHLYVFGIIGRVIPDTGHALLVPLWMMGVLALVPACRRWSAFKRATPPGSMWRLF